MTIFMYVCMCVHMHGHMPFGAFYFVCLFRLFILLMKINFYLIQSEFFQIQNFPIMITQNLLMSKIWTDHKSIHLTFYYWYKPFHNVELF